MYNRKEKASQGKVSAFKRSLNSYSTNYRTLLMSDASRPWSKQNFWLLLLRSRFQRSATTYVISICQKNKHNQEKICIEAYHHARFLTSVSAIIYIHICIYYTLHLHQNVKASHQNPVPVASTSGAISKPSKDTAPQSMPPPREKMGLQMREFSVKYVGFGVAYT